MQRKTALLVLALSLMAGALYAGASRTRASQAFSDEIPSPSQWVPFSADLRLTHLEPHGATAGKFWRAGDGSTRLETWAAADPATRLISIKNISQRTSFVKNPRGVWSAAPMDVPAAGWLPRKHRYSMPGLSEYSKRLDILEGRTGSLEAATGLRAFQFTSRNGTIWFLCPRPQFLPCGAAGRRHRTTRGILEHQVGRAGHVAL